MVESLDDAIAEVVSNGNCSGCGACCLLDPHLAMALDADGYLRPVRSAGGEAASSGRVEEFEQMCPGRLVRSPRPDGASRHPQLGSYLESWAVRAVDPDARYRGASGGVLTALSGWLTSSGRASTVIGAGQATDPRKTVSVEITDRETALASAGSRYAPVATASHRLALEPGAAVIAKPCEASALRRMSETRSMAEPPILLSFFCAGTPSQRATDDLVRDLSEGDKAPVTSVRYRGCGWPGDFTVTTAAGEHTMDYRTSWGDRLGPTMQWRCKICPDGVGESADLSVCDYWDVDERGYPLFEEANGRSGLLVRTERGRALLREALEEGVLVGERLAADRIADVQPGQTGRRRTLLGRLIGTRLAGVKVPAYQGFPLLRLAVENAEASLRTVRGARRRARAMRAAVSAGAGGVRAADD